jgi:D-lyxose ketol-isomerase
MDAQQLNAVKQQAQDLICKSGLALSADEWAQLAVNDLGLGDFEIEGFAFVDILRSERLRITVLVLLPGQTLPQHVHPPYQGQQGKEETLRVLYGHTKVFVEGDANTEVRVPVGKAPYYTARREIALEAGDQYTIAPGIKHWFQAGEQGSVNMTFQNRVDETKNIFDDPNSLGCPIKLTD